LREDEDEFPEHAESEDEPDRVRRVSDHPGRHTGVGEPQLGAVEDGCDGEDPPEGDRRADELFLPGGARFTACCGGGDPQVRVR
jgi:hypothetical protein